SRRHIRTTEARGHFRDCLNVATLYPYEGKLSQEVTHIDQRAGQGNLFHLRNSDSLSCVKDMIGMQRTKDRRGPEGNRPAPSVHLREQPRDAGMKINAGCL